MKLSDFGLCKPLDCSNLSSINENEILDDENLNETTDVDNNKNGRRWKNPLEQLQHWQMNRRKLVIAFFPHLQIVFIYLHANSSPAYLFISWQAFSTVGTPDYIAPEVLLKKGYGVECDWYVNILSHFHGLHLSIFCFHFLSI